MEIIIKALRIFEDESETINRISAKNFLTGSSLEACGLRHLVPILKQQCAHILKDKKVSYYYDETFLCSDILAYKDIFARIYDFCQYSEYKVNLLSYYFCGASIDLTKADFAGVKFAGKVLDYSILQQIPKEVKVDGAIIPRQSILT